MNQNILIFTAATLGFVHTVLGPDHYLPFIAISKARKWNITKTLGITAICGAGHVLGSILIGLIGVFSGIALHKLEFIESFRGSITAYLLIAFGLVYLVYGIRKALKNKSHKHIHVHPNGTIHSHNHTHNNEHAHVHHQTTKKNITPWILFIIFVFGPCEVLIPMLMYPAAQHNYGLLFAVTLVFAVSTIGTMLLMVALPILGFRFVSFKKVERFSHAFAGLLILMCGIAMGFLGL